MPPKSKFSKEQIIQSALNIIRQQGFEKLTARNLAEALEVSTKPIFVAFKNMEEVIEECRKAFGDLYNNFDPQIPQSPVYSAEKYVIFAKKEPFLFKFRYLEDEASSGDFTQLMKKLDENYSESVQNIQKLSNINDKKVAEKIYKNTWLFAHGIASLCVFGQCNFEYEEIHSLISEAAFSISNYLTN